ncbi:MAG: TatD family hydrolase [Oscillospiraceae bacterium]|nr:TatD family hydrolase [Candidatus Equicaccousia limihippi]
MTSIFDTHAHYYDTQVYPNIDATVKELKTTVCGVINCGSSYGASKKAIELAEKFDGFFYSAIGVHPEEIESEFDRELLVSMIKHKSCVAVGEIGLDYNFCDQNKDEQKDWFVKQVQLAAEFDKPIIVHDRDAHGDTMEILHSLKPKGVVHCFSGSPEMAQEVLDLGMYIGIGGVITFKNARKLPDVVKLLPLERLLLETDAPYLAPEPHRGTVNISTNIKYVAEKIAGIKEISPEDILKANLQNKKKLFGI